MTTLYLPVPAVDANLCNNDGPEYCCTRPQGHGGRHAGGYWSDGDKTQVVCGVWGDDVHKAARELGRRPGLGGAQ